MSARQHAEGLIRFIQDSPSPWQAAEQVRRALEAAGYTPLREDEAWALRSGGRYYVLRDGSSIIAFQIGAKAAEVGLRVVGAHTDSPGLRVKPRGGSVRAGVMTVGVEIYGGPILATFADRDLTLAGRLLVKGADGALEQRLVAFTRPLLRLSTPAIHLNREVNEQGLRFAAQEELPLILAVLDEQIPPDQRFRDLLAARAGVASERIVSWELAAVDTQPGALIGANEEFIASARLDNLASCHAALTALLAAPAAEGIAMCALFDHEEVGSESYKGAAGTFLGATVERLLEGIGLTTAQDRQRLLARSVLLSADMAHALHPNYARYYDQPHAPIINAGPVIKLNAKQRYATDAGGEAYFAALCEQAGVACQRYVHRNDMPCGSTIGPIVAARMGIRTVDVGNPMWSMHSIRECAGVADHDAMIRVLTRFYTDTAGLAL